MILCITAYVPTRRQRFSLIITSNCNDFLLPIEDHKKLILFLNYLLWLMNRFLGFSLI